MPDKCISLLIKLLTWSPGTVCVSMTEIMPGLWPLSRGGESAFLGAEGVFAPVTLWTMASPNIVKPLNAPLEKRTGIFKYEINELRKLNNEIIKLRILNYEIS